MSDVSVNAQTQVINVTQPTQSINVDPVTQNPVIIDPPSAAISVINAGPPGPSGSNAGYNFTQSSDSDVWTINHNLGYRPSVQIFTVGGIEMLGEIQHISVNQTLITFNNAVSGTARLT